MYSRGSRGCSLVSSRPFRLFPQTLHVWNICAHMTPQTTPMQVYICKFMAYICHTLSIWVQTQTRAQLLAVFFRPSVAGWCTPCQSRPWRVRLRTRPSDGIRHGLRTGTRWDPLFDVLRMFSLVASMATPLETGRSPQKRCNQLLHSVRVRIPKCSSLAARLTYPNHTQNIA